MESFDFDWTAAAADKFIKHTDAALSDISTAIESRVSDCSFTSASTRGCERKTKPIELVNAERATINAAPAQWCTSTQSHRNAFSVHKHCWQQLIMWRNASDMLKATTHSDKPAACNSCRCSIDLSSLPPLHPHLLDAQCLLGSNAAHRRS